VLDEIQDGLELVDPDELGQLVDLNEAGRIQNGVDRRLRHASPNLIHQARPFEIDPSRQLLNEFLHYFLVPNNK
jgi:hypothetical protein